MPPQETLRDYTYRCDSPDGPFTFRIRTGPGEIAIWLPERFEGPRGTYRVLGQVRAASGVKYQDGPVTVWTKGLDEALLEVDGEEFLSCRRNAQREPWVEAERLGVDFRAIGQEPGWHLEIREGERITFVYAYGDRSAIMPAPEPERTSDATVYHAETEAHDLTVTITTDPCTDTMSGERLLATVVVELDGETFRGCGRSLR
ncbi:MAG: MliC family protein [Rhodothermales bacterium]